MKKKILGLNYDDFESKEAFLQVIANQYHLAKEKGITTSLSYLNVHCVNLAVENEKFKNVLNSSEISFLDGVGLKIACNAFLRTKINFALTPPEWLHDFFCMLPQGTRIFFIGDEPKVIEDYNAFFTQMFPTLKSVGYHHGFFLKDPATEDTLFNTLRKVNPDIVIVGMGMPIQEFFIQKLKTELKIPMLIPVGAYYQRVLGLQKRPPAFISRIGMEWFYRFFMDPKRLFKRYIIGNPLFIYRVLKLKSS